MHPPQPPAYLVFGGLVRRPARPYLRSEWGDGFEERAPVCLVEPWLKNEREFEGQEVVVLSCVLASRLTAGLTHMMNRRLLRCNGQAVRNLAHLAELVDGADSASVLMLELDDDDVVALPCGAAREATRHVLAANLIPAERCLPPAPPAGALPASAPTRKARMAPSAASSSSASASASTLSASTSSSLPGAALAAWLSTPLIE
ncbi:unnamed protein product, partial [Prorocentrum cordatum]